MSNELTKNIGKLYLYDNNCTQIFKLGKSKSNSNLIKNKKRNTLIAITAKQLKQEINYFHKNDFDYFIARGLPPKADKNTTLAMILKNRFEEEKIFFYVFNNSKNVQENDIPFFHKKIPEGYSFFCSRNEYNQLMNFLKKNKMQNKIKKPKPEKFQLEPEPNKKHFICQICKIRFDNYLEHIHSKTHDNNKINFADTFNNIKNTFKKIVMFNKEKNREKDNKKIKVISHRNKSVVIKGEKKLNNLNGNENISSNILSDNINNETANSDSLFKENKISKNKKKKNIKNGLNYVNSSNKKLTKDNIDISLNDIKHILDTINCRPVINSFYNKKRKKNEILKNFFNENYINDFKKVTGKISHYNDLI